MNLNTRKTIIIDGEKITASVGLLNTIRFASKIPSTRGRKQGHEHDIRGRL